MPLVDLDHYFVRVKDLERSRTFYCDVLGFEVMPRPELPFPGYWLGINGKTQIHMGIDGIAEEKTFYLGTTEKSARDNAGVVDHIAFRGKDPKQLATRLAEYGWAMRTRYFPKIGLFQIFVEDPDGLTIELNFPETKEEPRLDGIENNAR